jgi:hypothetical protein
VVGSVIVPCDGGPGLPVYRQTPIFQDPFLENSVFLGGLSDFIIYVKMKSSLQF